MSLRQLRKKIRELNRRPVPQVDEAQVAEPQVDDASSPSESVLQSELSSAPAAGGTEPEPNDPESEDYDPQRSSDSAPLSKSEPNSSVDSEARARIAERLSSLNARRPAEPPSSPTQQTASPDVPPVVFTVSDDLLVCTTRTPLDRSVADVERFSNAVYFDIETSGLGSGATIFLTGFGWIDGSDFVVVQELARDVAIERDLVERARERLARAGDVVVYNGRSFDLPVLERRLRFHGVDALALPPERVTDLLHVSRRRFKKELKSCTLTNVGSHLGLLDRQRHRATLGDIPSAEIPDRFVDFCQTGELRWIEPVVIHNRLDVEVLFEIDLRVRNEPARPAQGDARSCS